MEENKNSRIFYVTLAVIVLVISLVIVTAVVAKRNEGVPPDATDNTTSGDTTTVDPNQPTISDKDLPDFTLPVNGAISFDYSDSIPVFSQTMGDYRTHLGVDISAELGAQVVAVADGKISNIWDDPFMGKCIAIEHSGNAVSIYKNLDPVVEEWLEVGCEVNKGDVIGLVGESAMNEIAEEPHLHYELKVDDTYVDPKDHFTFPTIDTNYEDEAS